VPPAQAWARNLAPHQFGAAHRGAGFLTPPGSGQTGWWIVGEVAKRLGFGPAFDFKSAADVFANTPRCRHSRNGGRDHIGAVLSDEAFDAMAPVLADTAGRIRRGAASPTVFFTTTTRRASSAEIRLAD
jgi:assimilatory nitrate reductase catalytic subunit